MILKKSLKLRYENIGDARVKNSFLKTNFIIINLITNQFY